MSWDRGAAADALVAVATAATAPLIPPATCLPKPPATFNPPTVVVQFPLTVTKHSPAFAIDVADLALLVAVGAPEGELLDQMLGLLDDAIQADQTLGGVVQVAKPTQWRNWRILTVAGADLLCADLALTIQM